MINVLSEVESLAAVLDLEFAACHICCAIELDLKVIQKQLVDLNKHILVHFELM